MRMRTELSEALFGRIGSVAFFFETDANMQPTFPWEFINFGDFIVSWRVLGPNAVNYPPLKSPLFRNFICLYWIFKMLFIFSPLKRHKQHYNLARPNHYCSCTTCTWASLQSLTSIYVWDYNHDTNLQRSRWNVGSVIEPSTSLPTAVSASLPSRSQQVVTAGPTDGTSRQSWLAKYSKRQTRNTCSDTHEK